MVLMVSNQLYHMMSIFQAKCTMFLFERLIAAQPQELSGPFKINFPQINTGVEPSLFVNERLPKGTFSLRKLKICSC